MKSNETTIKEVLDAFVEIHGLKEKLQETRLKQMWETIAGITVARYTTKLYVKKKKLYLEVSTPVIKQEISYSKSVFIELINKEIGKDFIREIVIF